MVWREEYEWILYGCINASLADTTFLEPWLIEVVTQCDGTNLEIRTTEVTQ
jgi:hypothetical protein